MTDPAGPVVPDSERAFYVDEFAGASIVAAVEDLAAEGFEAVVRVAESLAGSGARLVLVVSDPAQDRVATLAGALPSQPAVLEPPPGVAEAGTAGGPLDLGDEWLAGLWLAITDHDEVVITARAGDANHLAAEVAASLRAAKLVLTDTAGGWGRPPRSFADVARCTPELDAQLAVRQGGAVVAAIHRALDGGVTSVNLCRTEDLERELFTFDGAGSLFTLGDYVRVGPLRVDDLAAVERLVEQGTADGVLRPRSRAEVARLAVAGLGARVVGSGHLAGIVGLETEPYRATADGPVGEVACLYTVSRFSGAGAGGVLVDGLVERARDLDLAAVFAVTVSEAASAFFARKGFTEVDRDRLPPQKWAGYAADRLARARAFWLDLTPDDLDAG